MFSTFVLDAYRSNERTEVADALEGIASARDRYGFASGAVYCFWNWETREVLYIGRAIDLPLRFNQHNKGRGTGNKRKKIDEYFERHELLGYSVLVRSPTTKLRVVDSASSSRLISATSRTS